MEEIAEEPTTETGPEPKDSEPRARLVGDVTPGLRWLLQALREVAETVIPAVVIALLINLFLAQATQVLGQSMEPTLHSSQRIVIEKVTYHFHGPRRGDIVVIDLPEQSEMLIKRVVGLPGEKIEVRNGKVYIEGKQVEESWAVKPSGGVHYGPQTIPPLHVFVLGDNRGASNDSRNFGPVRIDHIVGHAWLSYWPPEHIGFVE